MSEPITIASGVTSDRDYFRHYVPGGDAWRNVMRAGRGGNVCADTRASSTMEADAFCSHPVYGGRVLLRSHDQDTRRSYQLSSRAVAAVGKYRSLTECRCKASTLETSSQMSD